MVKGCIDVLLPYLTAMCSASLAEGCLPVSQRHAVVTPLLKKAHLDAAEMKNYRPVSNLSFLSKVVERLVSAQLVRYLQEHNLMPCMQSAYRRHHSTETALLRVLSDIFTAADSRQVSLLGDTHVRGAAIKRPLGLARLVHPRLHLFATGVVSNASRSDSGFSCSACKRQSM